MVEFKILREASNTNNGIADLDPRTGLFRDLFSRIPLKTVLDNKAQESCVIFMDSFLQALE